MTAPPSGRQYELGYGQQRAVVVELGAGLREYSAGGAPIVDGYGRDRVGDGSRGDLLMPWPNRIANARYRFSGQEYRLPINEPRTGSAIHGLTRAQRWRLVDASEATVTLALALPPSAGYPFSLGMTVTYSLGGGGLTVRVTATNRGERPCPFGAGAHPYVRLAGDGLIDDALLRVPADATLEADARGIPTGAEHPIDNSDIDFRVPRPVGGAVLDTAFTRLRRDDDDITRISLTAADRRHGVDVWMDRSHEYAMIYSGDTLGEIPRRRRGLAIEPMTCAPDAFNSGAGLIVLQPGKTHTSVWGIAPL
ncbi:MAG: aldose 1-epimerase family protein [Candidatus Dormibacteria bacterium]